MAGTIFLDLTDEKLLIYPISGSAAVSPGDVVSVPIGAGYSFSLDQHSYENSTAYLSLPLNMIDFRIIEVPFSDREKVRELLPFEVDGLILGGSGSVIADLQVIGRSSEDAGKYKVLVAYVTKDLLKTLLGRLRSSGIDPVTVTSIELATITESSPAGDVAEKLINPQPMTDEERITAAAKGIKHPAFDFRRGEFAYTVEADKTKKSLRMTAFLTALLLMLFLADAAMNAFSVTRENRSIREEMRRVYTGLYPKEKNITNESYQLKAHIKELKEKADSLTGTSPLQFLLDLSVMNGTGAVMSEIAIEKELIVLKGECRSLGDVQKIKGDLERFLTAVNISDTRPSSQGKTLFTITAKGRRA